MKEERLIGAVIVGTGLPMVCTEQEILRGYFEEKEKDGFAMPRVLTFSSDSHIYKEGLPTHYNNETMF